MHSSVQPRQGRRRSAAPTIRDVARAAGVSVATVSRALNRKGPLREETARRVRRIVERLRYTPHGAARSLITRRTHTIGVLLPDIFGEFFSELIRGIDASARKRGYHVLVSGFHGHRAETRAMLRAMRGRVDGLIVLSADLANRELQASVPGDLPVVVLNGEDDGAFAAMSVDNYGGAFALARHMIGCGHRRFAVVGGPARNRDAAERLRGYRDGLGRKAARGALMLPGDFREEAGYRAATRILRKDPRPSAVLAANDAMAIGLLSAFRERRVRVPEDVAVTGFDDIPIARFVNPPLTTVRVPITELGAGATTRLLAAIEADPVERARREVLPTSLVVRSSCGSALGDRSSCFSPTPAITHRKRVRDPQFSEEGSR